MTILICLFLVGWIAASILGTQAYFLGEQTKPIHNRNWKSESFEKLAKAVTDATLIMQSASLRTAWMLTLATTCLTKAIA